MSEETMRMVTKNLWFQVGKLRNPWLTAVVSHLDGYREKWDRWNRQHVELMHAMFDVVFGKTPPTESLVMSSARADRWRIEP